MTCGGCNPTLPTVEKLMTVREWDERHQRAQERRTRPSLAHRVGEAVAAVLVCPDCLLPRLLPVHWWHR